MRHVIARLVMGSALVGGWPATIGADPVMPHFSNIRFATEGDSMVLAGSGFSLATDPFASWVFFPVIGAGGCAGTSIAGSTVPCHAGDMVDQSLRTAGDVGLGRGSATFGSATYSNVVFRGAFEFRTVPAVFPDTSAESVVLAAPFRFEGFIRGFADGQELFAHRFIGSGTTERAFYLLDAGGYSFQMESNVSYLFDDVQIAPVPEPSTLLLFGSAAGLIAARRKRRARLV